MLLEVRDLNTYYGKSHVLQDMFISVDRGEIVALLGRNGMGKSTTLKSIMGLVQPVSGSIVYNGKDIFGYAPYQAARTGIAKQMKIRFAALKRDAPRRIPYHPLSSTSDASGLVNRMDRHRHLWSYRTVYLRNDRASIRLHQPCLISDPV